MSSQKPSVETLLRSKLLSPVKRANWPFILFVLSQLLVGTLGCLLQIHWQTKYDTLQDKYDTAMEEQAVDQALLDLVFGEYNRENIQLTEVTVTAYSPNDPKQGTKYQTASGEYGFIGQCAISRDLLKEVNFGDTVLLVGIGKFIITDLLARGYTKRIDLFVPEKKVAKLFGVKPNVTMIYMK
jgi:3D (Asp-Asp-Asp) domain-containing protein